MITLLYLTDRENSGLIPDERGIKRVFRDAGVKIDIKVWDEVDWEPYRNILVRTPWDYSLKPGLFLEKINAATRRGAAVIHPESIIKWNIDKNYLVELSQAGHKVVPTHVEDGFMPAALGGYFKKYGTLVLKPRIGAGGRDTFRLSPEDGASKAASLSGTSVLIQPFVPEIETMGEHSFIFFEEEFSHAVLKKAKSGEFRVQDDHGGIVEAYAPSDAEIKAVRNILKSVNLDTVYARVDVVRWNGDFHLMELEIIEPELFFRFSNKAMEWFAQVVRKRLLSSKT